MRKASFTDTIAFQLIASVAFGIVVASVFLFIAVMHAFNDIAARGNASPAVVAAGVGELLLYAAIIFVIVATSIACVLIRRARKPRRQ